ncbi:MAG: glycogen/starch synthase [Syntrophales bacterium LBB04]|nr:glycogen/starch synthase [Syntrophales bacterium LBB04]
MKGQGKTAVLLLAPETGRLPEEMGGLAHFVSGKTGGMGEVVAALCEGLTARGVECHFATLNLRGRFQKEGRLSDDQWHELCHFIDPERIHLVTSSVFSDLASAYSGNPILNAAEFQKEIVNHTITRVRAMNGGRLIVHSHDWMAGGTVTAYARASGCPVLHTVHNVHTGHIPREMLFGVDLHSLRSYLYLSEDYGKTCIDSQATAIKNASLVNFVGYRFLRELIDGHFADSSIIPWSVREEVRHKHAHGQTTVIINAPAPGMHPEHCPHLVKNYGPEDDVLAVKRENLVAFQKITGLNIDPNAILLYWPSRLDPSQKGIQLLEEIAQRFVNAHGDVQIAIVGDGVGRDRTHEENCGRIACASGGKIAYQRFSEPLSMLGFAAASDVFGASLYEPCGQIDQIGNLCGATATNRDTGGYHDKIVDMEWQAGGALAGRGNGFLFRDYDAGGLWYGLSRTVAFHRQPPEVREAQIRRIMRETRESYSPQRMIDSYMAVYKRLNGGRPLV